MLPSPANRDQSEGTFDGTIGNISKFFVTADKAVMQLEVAKISEQGVGLLQELRGTNERLKKITDNPKIDEGLNDLAAGIKGIRGVVDESGADETKALKDLLAISTRLKPTTKRIDEVLADPKVDKIIADLSTTTEHVAPAALELRKLLKRLDSLFATQQQDIQAITRALRDVLENVEILSEVHAFPTKCHCRPWEAAIGPLADDFGRLGAVKDLHAPLSGPGGSRGRERCQNGGYHGRQTPWARPGPLAWEPGQVCVQGP